MAVNRRLFAVVVFLLVFVELALLYGRAVIQNDGITYYALTHSLIHDHDFDLTNQARHFRDLRTFHSSKIDRIASTYSCGFAFLYAPFLMLTGLLSSLNSFRPYAQNATIPFADSIGIFIGSLLFGLLSIFFAYKMLRNYDEQKSWMPFLVSIAIFFGTPLIFYTFTIPSFIHVSDTFLFSVIFFLTILKRPGFAVEVGAALVAARGRPQGSPLLNILIGFLLGLSVLLRNINFILIVPIVLAVLYFDRKTGRKQLLLSLAEVVAGALPVCLIQLSFNWHQYGSLFTTGYRLPVTDEVSDFYRMFKAFWRMSLHPSMGIFIWSPIAILALGGLILGCTKRKPHAILAMACIVSVVASLCFFRIMWPGASFGNRYLTQLYIFWVVGFYEILLVWKKPAIFASAVCILWSFLLFNAYYINSPAAARRTMLAELHNVTPIKVLQQSAENYSNNPSSSNPFVFWYRSLGSRPYPALHFFIWHWDSRHRNVKAVS